MGLLGIIGATLVGGIFIFLILTGVYTMWKEVGKIEVILFTAFLLGAIALFVDVWFF